MKKITFLLLTAVIVAACGKKSNDENNTNDNAISQSQQFSFAVVNVDTLMSQYEFAKISNEKLIKKQEDSRLKINLQVRQLQNEMIDFQKKIENNAFLTRERAESEQRRLQKKQSDLEALDRELTQSLMQEQQTLSQQFRDSINAVIAVLNKDGKYELIISTSAINDNVLYAKPQYDITQQVLDALNARYAKKKK
ncbi:MAG: OmpH family outer membrane protein [Paludibacteraceae bacterium]|jgi:outer membrane protein|nr:OmpH family outer membrane protein [Paludibacteraceae bacterium]MDI9537320.1 OmpH family outer membrane protein [Bacteroidota bacterium]HHT61123.1 OmpH family outer membrane protein [Bacteroidales bacterium]MBP9039474.1 OmpH family outer membrane protein [Paludibacteraceae bacterium]HOA46186.1 OmpH family outer membrane protein [Paludibacteraceae bacterium]